MGWTVYYEAEAERSLSKGEIKWIDEHQAKWNSEICNGSERYCWDINSCCMKMSGTTKIHFSENPENDFVVILKALQEIENYLSDWKLTVSDDYYISEENPHNIGDPLDFISRAEAHGEESEPGDSLGDYIEMQIKHKILITIQDNINKHSKIFANNAEFINSIEVLHNLEELLADTEITGILVNSAPIPSDVVLVLGNGSNSNARVIGRLQEVRTKVGIDNIITSSDRYILINITRKACS
jgi:hypothetical protein